MNRQYTVYERVTGGAATRTSTGVEEEADDGGWRMLPGECKAQGPQAVGGDFLAPPFPALLNTVLVVAALWPLPLTTPLTTLITSQLPTHDICPGRLPCAWGGHSGWSVLCPGVSGPGTRARSQVPPSTCHQWVHLDPLYSLCALYTPFSCWWSRYRGAVGSAAGGATGKSGSNGQSTALALRKEESNSKHMVGFDSPTLFPFSLPLLLCTSLSYYLTHACSQTLLPLYTQTHIHYHICQARVRAGRLQHLAALGLPDDEEESRKEARAEHQRRRLKRDTRASRGSGIPGWGWACHGAAVGLAGVWGGGHM